jgi:hypothetical protein
MKDFLKAACNPMGWIFSILIVALLGCMQQVDRRDEIAHAKAMEAAQKQAAKDERRQRRAQAMCSKEKGPHVLAVWVDSVTVECLNQRGRNLASYPMEAHHAE